MSNELLQNFMKIPPLKQPTNKKNKTTATEIKNIPTETKKMESSEAPKDFKLEYTCQNQKFVTDLKYLEINDKIFLDKSVVFYGPSQSGKTVLLHYALWVYRHIFPVVIAHVPTNASTHDYDGIIPEALIYEKIDLDFLSKMYDRQINAAETYNVASKEQTLKKLFGLINPPDGIRYLEQLDKLHKKAFNAAKAQGCSNSSAIITEIEDDYNENKMNMYKTFIKAYKSKLSNFNLNEEEQYVLKYINFNPKLLFLNDDATKELEKLFKDCQNKKSAGDNGSKNESVLENIFYKGRHAQITHWYAFHNITKVKPEIRDNAFWSIFTAKNIATNFFITNKSNSFSAQEKKAAEAIIKHIFTSPQMPPHSKLIYKRMDGTFYYTVAKVLEKGSFTMCSEAAKTLNKKLKKENDKFNKSNTFYKKIENEITE